MTYNNINKAKEIWSSIGKVKAPATARVSGQEIIVNPSDNQNDGNAFIIPKGKEGADDQLANVKDEDGILGGKLDPRTGVPFYANPIDRAAAKGVHTIDNIMYKLQKNYINREPGQLGYNTIKLTQQQTTPMKQEFMKRLNTSLDLQRQIPSEEEMKQGLIAARIGKNSLRLPGFENSKDPYTQNDNILDQYHFQRLYPFQRLEAAMPAFGDPNKDYGTVDDIEYTPVSQYAIPDLNINISEELKKNPVKPIPSYAYISHKNNEDEEGPWKINPQQGVLAELPNWIAGFGQAWKGMHQRISSPNFAAANPTANMALSGLANLGYTDYEFEPDMAKMERLAAYANNNSGNTGGVVYAGNIASRLALAKQMADRRIQAQQYRNQLKQHYYDTALSYGNQQQQYMSDIARANYAARAASHNAATQFEQMGLRNMIEAGQQAYRNYSQAKMYNGMRGMYWKDLTDKEKQAIREYNRILLEHGQKGGNK